MAPIVTEAVVKASRETIWNACFESMNWEKWDSDIEELTELTGGLKKGTKYVVVMKNEDYCFQGKIAKVKENQSFVFLGKVLGTKTVTRITLVPDEDDNEKTKITYSFDFHGLFGYFLTFLSNEEFLCHIEENVENIIKLSQEAQKSV